MLKTWSVKGVNQHYLGSNQNITSLKDLFDLEGCVMPTLMENDMTNKPIGSKSI